MPRHKEPRSVAFAVLEGPHFDSFAQGGTFLPALKDSAHSAEHEGIPVRAREVRGHTSAVILGAAENGIVVLAADARIALGPGATELC